MAETEIEKKTDEMVEYLATHLPAADSKGVSLDEAYNVMVKYCAETGRSWIDKKDFSALLCAYGFELNVSRDATYITRFLTVSLKADTVKRMFKPRSVVQLGEWYIGIMIVGAMGAFLNDAFHLSSQNISPVFGAILALFLMAFLHYFDMVLNGQI